MANSEPLWDISETARFLHLSVKTLYKLTCSRKIPHLKIGQRVLFDPETIRLWAAEHVVEPVA
jgi:excisionase family DNA binding protein